MQRAIMANGTSDITEYTASDYSAVDKQLDEIARRERAETRKLQYANYFGLAQTFAIICLSLGALALLIGFAIYLAKREAKTIIQQEQIPVQAQREENIRNINPETYSEGKLVEDYTIFYEGSADMHGFGEVVTGYRYKDSTTVEPYHIYCYINKNNQNGTTTQIMLGQTDENGLNPSLAPNRATDILTLTQQNRLFNQKCRWPQN